ncbi:stage III sporulation protein AG [Geomicrobium sediminis]|uniref:Stage III sporulation protein AG n=1 Tax=Geomicrobium sediminis TaxID=1347788 RepID=A0ABS2PDZ8_9BACL|nr:stage III sporulation protein AG [Geomicrobium sediminis]MBM7633652.1 stage III sporulation protein AG [Geomicrobium sediminis]
MANKDTSKFKELISQSSNGPKKIRWYYIVGLIVLGLLLMMIGTSGDDEDDGMLQNGEVQNEPVARNTEQSKPSANAATEFQLIEQAYGERLQQALETIDGISNVDVVVNVKETESKVYEKDRSIRQQTTDEADTEGGNRTLDEGTEEETLVLVQQGGTEEPLLIRVDKPDVTGVLVVANGVESMQRKEWVIEAVTRTLDVPAHRVSVMPKQLGKDE